MFRLDFQCMRVAILKPAHECQTALGRSKEHLSAALRPRCYHICLPQELSLPLTGPCRTRRAPGGKRGNRVEEERNGMEELE